MAIEGPGGFNNGHCDHSQESLAAFGMAVRETRRTKFSAEPPR